MKFRVALLVLVLACVPPPLAADDSPLRAALQADLTQYLNARAKPEHISTVSLSISFRDAPQNLNVTAGTTRYDGAGSPVTPENLFQIGSNTKAFTAVTVLQLEAEGKLTIDQTLGRWLPQYPAWKDVTIRRLLNMTSGIPSYDNVPSMMRAYAAHPYRNWSAAELVATVYPSPKPILPPTKGYSYSNTNYILAQMIVERATGHSYTSEIHKRFLRAPSFRLGSTFYSPRIYPPTILDRTVHGYFFSDDPDNASLARIYGRDVWDYSLSWTQGAGGIIASPEDVTHWARQLYEGAVLAPKQRQELMSLISTKTGNPIAQTTAADSRGFGLGVAQVLHPKLGRFWFYEGETLGYRTLHVWFPKSDVIFAVAVNSQPNAKEDKTGALLVESIYASLHAAGRL